MDSKDLKKKKRRPRSAAGERNYLCGCGKAYLSYPALYTHVKNKHDGIFPIGSNAKRKIPKSSEEDSVQMYVPNIDRYFQEFEEFTKQVYDASRFLQTPIRAEDIAAAWKFRIDTEERDLQPLKQAMASMLLLELDKEKSRKSKQKLNIYQILGLFLNSIFRYCSENFFREYSLLTVLIIKALNEKGELFLDKNEKRKSASKSEEPKKNFCETDNINVTAEILNLFIAELFPLYFKKMAGEENFTVAYLGLEDENIKNLILMTKYMANWLFNSEFTEYRLEINVDF